MHRNSDVFGAHMQAFVNQQLPDIQALFSQFLAQLPPAHLERLDSKANGQPDLRKEQRTHVNTSEAAHYLSRKPQTLRGWNSAGDFPIDDLRPTAINGRLAWPVTGIKKVMGVL